MWNRVFDSIEYRIRISKESRSQVNKNLSDKEMNLLFLAFEKGNGDEKEIAVY